MSCSTFRNTKKRAMNIDQHIFIRYFLGQASEEEKETIHQWIFTHTALVKLESENSGIRSVSAGKFLFV